MNCVTVVDVSTTTTTPELASYDYIVVNSSAGKDSQAMLDYVAELSTDPASGVGLRTEVLVVHCDLGRAEWEGTLELAEEQTAHYGLRFEVVKRDGTVYRGKVLGDLITQVEERHASNLAKGKDQPSWPSSEARWCTSDQKTGQVLKLFTRLVEESGIKGRPVRILNCLGIRADESPKRSQMTPFSYDEKASNGLRHVDRWYPIFDWSVKDVWARIKASGVRYHDAYAAGMPRLSCCFCVLAGNAELALSAKLNPGLAQEYVAVEDRTGYTFKNGISMRDILAAAARSTVEELGAAAADEYRPDAFLCEDA